MNVPKTRSGTSLLEVLMSLSLFSIIALQSVAFCLRLHNMTRQCLYDTQSVVLAGSLHQIQMIEDVVIHQAP